jgi:hypothetical protein
MWIGLNLLSRDPAAALKTALETCGAIDGIWSDNAGVDERAGAQPRADLFVTARRERGWNARVVRERCGRECRAGAAIHAFG